MTRKHVHHWVLAGSGVQAEGRCTGCRARRSFTGGIADYGRFPDDHAAPSAVGAARQRADLAARLTAALSAVYNG